MKIRIQKKNFDYAREINSFAKKNANVGAVASFLGKVRKTKKNKQIISIDIECYKAMATFQIKKVVKKLNSKILVNDYLIIHRYGKLLPNENIVLVLVASKHRKESFIFLESLVDWLKAKVSFWKKENFINHSEWVEQEKEDLKKLTCN